MLNERFVGLSADDPPKSSASRPAAEQARWNRAAVSGSRRTKVYPHACDYLRRSNQVESSIGDPKDARRSCIVLHDLHSAVGAIQKDRALPKQQHRGHPTCQLAKEVPGFAKRLHRRRYIDRITRPICTLRLPIPPPRSRHPFFSEVSSFSLSKGPIDER
jgi:hypothetical protein